MKCRRRVGIAAAATAVAWSVSAGAQGTPYDVLREEAGVYQRGASDYRATIETVIELHYREKKRAILDGLDREIRTEKARLDEARATAIRRLEEFVASHSGKDALPEVTPDAMFRLAALYEERARAADDAGRDAGAALRPAIALYKRVIREFPAYREVAGVYYFLGHALADAGRPDEAQQVWRSLVCHDRYPYPVATDPHDPDRDVVTPLPQDRDAAVWKKWRATYRSPRALDHGPREETTFQDPYPSDCRMIPQPGVTPGAAPKYIAEVWWRIGEWEFDQLDAGGGVVEGEPYAVWDYDRAERAYAHAMQVATPPIYGVALYKHAWTLFKQQRYEAAVRDFVHLLQYTDERQRVTGDPGADFRQEAYTYIAGSLDNLDFAGPGPDEPYIARPDILDTARSPAEAEARLRVAIDRVQDARLVPQEAPWTIDVYSALAAELRAIGEYKNALAVTQRMLDRWPLEPSAPESQNAIAELDELLASQTKVGDERRGYEQQVLIARTALSHYVGDTPWVDANKDNPAALRRAEELVRTGLSSAAASHTRNGQAAVEQAEKTADTRERARLAAHALDEYRLAAVGWRGVVEQSRPDTRDAYRSRYFLADALHEQVRLAVRLAAFDPAEYGEPTPEEVAAATESAIAVRDSDEDDALLENAGVFVVDLADVDRDVAFARYRSSKGAQGLAPRTGPRVEGPAGDRKVVVEALPEVVAKSMQARDEYARRVPSDRDTHGHASEYALYGADQLYVYGHFEDARSRLEPLYRDHCAKDPIGYEAWKRLISMSNLQGDIARSRSLAETEKAKSCAYTEEQLAEERSGVLTDRVLESVAFEEAREATGAARDPQKTIDAYKRLIDAYGKEEALARLEREGGEAYAQRVRELGVAYDAVSRAYYEVFAYDRAAEWFARTAGTTHFDGTRRVAAARIAMVLYADLGDRARMAAMHGVLADPKMPAPANTRIEADYLEASFDYRRWEQARGGDAGDVAATRRRAIAALSRFHGIVKDEPDAGAYALEAAHRVGEMMRAGHDEGLRDWLKTTVADWEHLDARQSGLAREPPYADYGAQADYELLDREIRERFDTAAGRPRYGGTVLEVRKQVDADLEAASKKWQPLLDRVAERYGSFEWATVATVREGSLYDTIRTALDLVVPAYFTPQQTALFGKLNALAGRLSAAGQSNQAARVQEQVADAQQQVRDAWHGVKSTYLDACDRRLTGRYATATVVAREHDLEDDAVRRALSRLAYYSDVLGDDAMRRYVESTLDPRDPGHRLTYEDGEFLRWRSGIAATPPSSGQPGPLPAAP